MAPISECFVWAWLPGQTDPVPVGVLEDHWDEAADFARLTQTERLAFWGAQILNPAASYRLQAPSRHVAQPKRWAGSLRVQRSRWLMMFIMLRLVTYRVGCICRT
jgi:hypothetical protein